MCLSRPKTTCLHNLHGWGVLISTLFGAREDPSIKAYTTGCCIGGVLLALGLTSKSAYTTYMYINTDKDLMITKKGIQFVHHGLKILTCTYCVFTFAIVLCGCGVGKVFLSYIIHGVFGCRLHRLTMWLEKMG